MSKKILKDECMKIILILGLLLFSFTIRSQIKCSEVLVADSCSLQNPLKKEWVDVIDVKIKNNYQVQFIKHHNQLFLKLIIRNDLGYGKTGSLVLFSGKKQYYTKSITLQIIDKQSAYFLLELNSNYITTLKDNGLTSFVFRENVEFSIPKNDSELVEQGANCFYEATTKK